MKKIKWYRVLIAISVIILFAHGFSEGMQWHRILCVNLGGFLLGILAADK